MKASTKKSDLGEVILFAIAVIALSGSFIRLGFWQLDRAHDLKRVQSVKPSTTVIDLLDVAQPGSNLSGSSVNRIVRFSGRYVAQYLAPHQANGGETWRVGLMEIPDIGAILVARGVQESKNISQSDLPPGLVDVVGRLMPRQFDDRAPTKEGSLVRIDSSLIVGDTDLALFDGFVIAQSEKSQESDTVIESMKRIDASPAKPTVPGFYWQHIAYVAIWWLAAGVVLFLPFYQRIRKREQEEGLTHE